MNAQAAATGATLIEVIPEVRDGYRTDDIYWHGDQLLGHVFVGLVLNPPLMEWLRQEDQLELLHRVFGFIERMATEGDEAVKEILGATICEHIVADVDAYEVAKRYMGKVTQEYCQAFLDYMNAPENQAWIVSASDED